MIHCVVFDFDGTLAQSNAIKQQAYFEAAKAIGDIAPLVRAALAEVPGNRSLVCRGIVLRAEQAGSLPATRSVDEWVRHLVETYTTWSEAAISACPEVPGADAALHALRGAGMGLFINSATPVGPLERILAMRGMRDYFKAVLGSPAGKVENLETVLERERTSPGEMAFVGDNEVDRIAALKMGCHFVGLENEFSGYKARPAVLVGDLHGLPQVLSGLGRTVQVGTGEGSVL